MAIVDELVAVLGYRLTGEENLARFNAGLGRAESKMRAFAAAAMRWGAVAAAAIGAGGVALAKGVIDTSAEFERYQASLETIEGSTEKAKASLDWIAEFATKTPYELAGVTEAFIKLKTYGIDPIADDALRTLGDTASAMGKPINQAVEALADAATFEFERLKEFGLRAQQKGNEVTFTWTENGKQLSKVVKKNSEDVRKFILDNFGSRFAGAMIRQSKTWDGMLSNFSDGWTNFLRKIGDAGFFEVVKGKLAAVMDYVDRMQSDGALDRWAKRISGAFSYVVDPIGTFVDRTATHLDFLLSVFERLGGSGSLSGFFGAIGKGLGYLVPFRDTLIDIALALEDLLTWMEGGDSVFGKFVDAATAKLTAFGKTVIEIVSGVRDFLAAEMERFANSFSTLGDVFGGLDWSGAGSRLMGSFFDGIKSVGEEIKAYFMSLIPDWASGFFGGGMPAMAPAGAPAMDESAIRDMLNGMDRFKNSAADSGAAKLGQAIVTDNRSDNRQFPISVGPVTVNVSQPAAAPGAVGAAVAGAVGKGAGRGRAQLETPPAF